MAVDFAEFAGAYLAELDEHLAAAQKTLLVLDAAVRSGARDPRSVHELFRVLHTIKGLSAMVGVEPVVDVAHHMEAILRSADKRSVSLDAAAVDVLFRGAAFIGAAAEALSKQHPAPSASPELLRALERCEVGEAKARPRSRVVIVLPDDLLQKLVPFEREQLERGATEGKRVLRANFFPSPERAAAGFTITSVRERVRAIGDIVKVVPLATGARAASSGLCFALLVITAADDVAIATALGTGVDAIENIVAFADPEGDDEPTAKSAEAIPLDLGGIPPDDDLDDAGPPRDVDYGATSPSRRDVLRVDVGRIDDAMEKLSSLIVTRSRLSRIAGTLQSAGADTRELAIVIGENARQLRDLRAAILRVRMVPLSDLLDRLALVIRSLRRSTGKAVRLEVDNGGAELDKAVAERLFPALLHLVRNAVDHGIETPAARIAAGKPEEGVVRVTCEARAERSLVLDVADDGRGVDRQALAGRLGVPPFADDEALLDALCQAGVSTRDEVTTTSGRGLGMDIVRRTVVDQLGDELVIRSEQGVGTAFTLEVPITIAIADVFSLTCAGQRYVVPVAAVDEIVEVEAHSLTSLGTAGGAEVHLLSIRGEAVATVDLAAALGLSGPLGTIGSRGAPRYALIVRRGASSVAFLVDRMRGQQEAVVRPLTDPLVAVVGIIGATDLGDGVATLVLDLPGLASRGASEKGRAA